MGEPPRQEADAVAQGRDPLGTARIAGKEIIAAKAGNWFED